MPTEPLPASDVLDILTTTWDFNKVTGATKNPGFVEVTGSGDPLRVDLNVNDQIIGRAGNPAMDEQPIGNYKYGNRQYMVELTVYTLVDRQRLYNIMREIRRICHVKVHGLINFQRVKFVNFSEQTQQQVNMWVGTIGIQLENRAVLLETT
tara:strand:+ start:55 stop:507 length:453 start_codon:yes stop_codon:yes gene_type:complete